MPLRVTYIMCYVTCRLCSTHSRLRTKWNWILRFVLQLYTRTLLHLKMGGHKILFRHCKFKVITLHANKACGEVWLRLRVFLTLVLGGSEWSSLFRGRLTRGEKKNPLWYLPNRRLVGPQSLSGSFTGKWVWFPRPGVKPRVVRVLFIVTSGGGGRMSSLRR